MGERPGRHQIGTLNEKPLHAALKAWCAEAGDLLEVPIDGFVADIVRGNLVIEIQTGSASRLKRKIETLIRRRPVRLVLPIAIRKTIVRIDETGTARTTRRSPKRGTPLDAFRELLGLRDLLGDSNLSVDVLLIHEEEVRKPRGKPHWRKDWQVVERRLVEVVDCISFHETSDYLAAIPWDLREPFSTADLADAAVCSRRTAQLIVYVLRKMGALRIVGKEGNAILYVRAAT